MREEEIEIQMREIAENIYKTLKKEGKIKGYDDLINLTYPQFYKWGKDGKEKILSKSGMYRAIIGERGMMLDVFSAIAYSFLKAGADKENVKKLIDLYFDYSGITAVMELLNSEN